MNFKKITYCYIILFVLFQTKSISQKQTNDAVIDKNLNYKIYVDPNTALAITEVQLSQPNIKGAERAKLIFQTAKAYKVKGENSNSLKYLYQADTYKNYLSKKDFIDIEIEKIDILVDILLIDEAKKILEELEQFQKSITDSELKTYCIISINLEKARVLYYEGKLNKAIELLDSNFKNGVTKFPELELWNTIILGQTYLANNDLNNSSKYFDSALKMIDQIKEGNYFAKMFTLEGMANISFRKKDYNKTILLLNQTLNIAVSLNNFLVQESVINMLNVNYLAVNDTQQYKETSAKLTEFNTKIYNLEQESVNTAFNLISQQQIDRNNEKLTFYYNIEYAILLFVLLVIIYVGIVGWRIKQSKSKLNEVINYLQITRSNFLNDTPIIKDNSSKKHLIPKETEELILSKLKKFESSKKFTNKDISLAVLAGQFETNTKYLSEVINSNYQINFNTYINKLRVNFIIDKIKKDPNFKNYKISYLAEHSGFSSHSSFATVFKSLTGLSPITFIDLVKSENETKDE